MPFITAHQGRLQTLSDLESTPVSMKKRPFSTGLEALDAMAPDGKFVRGAVHELLFAPSDPMPCLVAAMIAKAAGNSPIIWSDPHLYPPALAALGFDLSRLYLLRPENARDESWAITECLRCRGVGAVVASPTRISRIEARRFQLAAERGGGVGVFLRPRGRGDSIYAAATRWLVAPYRGEPTIQRWTIQLLHGHGGRIGQTVFLEWSRENNSVRAIEKLPDRQTAPETPQRVASKRSVA
jgi:protein ImuA